MIHSCESWNIFFHMRVIYIVYFYIVSILLQLHKTLIVIIREVELSPIAFYDPTSSSILTSRSHDSPLMIVAGIWFLRKEPLSIHEYSTILMILRSISLDTWESISHFGISEDIYYWGRSYRDTRSSRHYTSMSSIWRDDDYVLLEEK